MLVQQYSWQYTHRSDSLPRLQRGQRLGSPRHPRSKTCWHWPHTEYSLQSTMFSQSSNTKNISRLGRGLCNNNTTKGQRTKKIQVCGLVSYLQLLDLERMHQAARARTRLQATPSL